MTAAGGWDFRPASCLLAHATAFLWPRTGATIALIGVTRVLVPEDLEFVQTTVEALRAVRAHDSCR